jgi:hypothetical protein
MAFDGCAGTTEGLPSWLAGSRERYEALLVVEGVENLDRHVCFLEYKN